MALSSSPCCFSPRHLLLPSSLTVLPRSLPSSLSLSLCSSSRYFVENNILSSDAKEHPGAIVNDTLLVRSNHITLVTLYEGRDNAAPCQLNSVCCDFEAGVAGPRPETGVFLYCTRVVCQALDTQGDLVWCLRLPRYQSD